MQGHSCTVLVNSHTDPLLVDIAYNFSNKDNNVAELVENSLTLIRQLHLHVRDLRIVGVYHSISCLTGSPISIYILNSLVSWCVCPS